MTGPTNRRSFVGGASAALLAGVAPRAAWGKTQTDVIVIGAGLAGLTAALALEAQGLKVQVLEARMRVGGRTLTLDDLPGRPEAGGLQVGEGYGRVRALAERAGVTLIDPDAPNSKDLPGWALSIGGVLMASSQWAASPANKLPAAERATAPYALLQRALAPWLAELATANPAFADPNGWHDASAAQLAVSLDQPFGGLLKARGLSDVAIQLIEADLNAPGLNAVSGLQIIRSGLLIKTGSAKTFRVAGGAQRLAESAAARLATPVQLGAVVTGIGVSRSGGTVRLADGRVLGARHIICAVPPTVARMFKIAAPLSKIQEQCLRQQPMTPVVQVHGIAKSRFWDDDGLPRNLWSDSPIERVFDYGGSHDGADNLVVWINGAGALAATRREMAEPGSLIGWATTQLEALRPASKGRFTLSRVVNWHTDPFARGAYASWGPGQMLPFAGVLAKPTGRLHFAGEHTAAVATGLEGACESGERAAVDVLSS